MARGVPEKELSEATVQLTTVGATVVISRHLFSPLENELGWNKD